jgi:transcriptional regulator
VLIHPWDAALDDVEWQEWVAGTDRFGMLVVNNLDPAAAPLVLPTHFTLAGSREIVLHLARPNPVWPHLDAAAQVRLALVGDYAYIPSYWRAKAGGPDEDGVPAASWPSGDPALRGSARRPPAEAVEASSAIG